MIRVKRTYDPAACGDGRRILVERLWPRGIRTEALAADAWAKAVAPSTGLRKWFGHRAERWEEFRRRYREELDANPTAWEPILEAGRRGTVTLLYSARDTLHNGALVLRDYLAEREAEPGSAGNATATARSEGGGRAEGLERRRRGAEIRGRDSKRDRARRDEPPHAIKENVR